MLVVKRVELWWKWRWPSGCGGGGGCGQNHIIVLNTGIRFWRNCGAATVGK